jgi:hypothetical protein
MSRMQDGNADMNSGDLHGLDTSLSGKRRTTGLVLASLGIVVWLIFFIKGMHKPADVLPADIDTKPFIANVLDQQPYTCFPDYILPLIIKKEMRK